MKTSDDPCEICLIQPCCTKDCKDRVYYIMQDEINKLSKEFKDAGAKLPPLSISIKEDDQLVIETDNIDDVKTMSVFDAVVKHRMEVTDRLKRK